MRPVIEVAGLTAVTDSAVLLHGVDLEVLPGRVTALVGPSGSGKTTTALALLGEAQPGVRLRGSVRVAGSAVVDDGGVTAGAAAVRGSTVAYMPQHPGSALNPARRTGAVLRELSRLHGREGREGTDGGRRAPGGGGGTPGGPSRRARARDGAAEALRLAQLPDTRDVLRRFPHQFSGGQRQRVALAQVLACGPRALVLDEPGTGLDTVTRMGLTRELADLARTGIAILLLSHDHAMVRALADHVVVLESGRVTAAGPADEVLPGPAPRAPGSGPVPGLAGLADAAGTPPSVDPGAPRAGAEGPVTARSAVRVGSGTPAAGAASGAAAAGAGVAGPGAEGAAPARSTAPGWPEVSVAPSGRPGLLVAEELSAWLRPGRRGEVLSGVSLAVGPGDCLAVAGRSGSGKTTLARCLAGLHERHDGRLLLDGVPLPVLRHRDRTAKRRVQYVWQEVRGSFDERRTVLDQVARTAVRLRALAPAEAATGAAELLARLGVGEETARRRPEALSGGELQRAAFARAVLAGPDVLVCDEITTALDATATQLVVAEVGRLRRESGTAVVWIGHDLGLLRTVADRLLVLDGGRVVEEGACAGVLTAPRAEATRLLLRAEHLAPATPAPAVRPAVRP
ncbi:ABC transporter ATP-binding protein [Streptomyces sp. NPDC093065]|uniref:ABC transporter ATP-binding protein n=1 Tax=Streptomyces sp. NPDC093065 TaxID=3366021 RepID=UPI0038074B3B